MRGRSCSPRPDSRPSRHPRRRCSNRQRRDQYPDGKSGDDPDRRRRLGHLHVHGRLGADTIQIQAVILIPWTSPCAPRPDVHHPCRRNGQRHRRNQQDPARTTSRSRLTARATTGSFSKTVQPRRHHRLDWLDKLWKQPDRHAPIPSIFQLTPPRFTWIWASRSPPWR